MDPPDSTAERLRDGILALLALAGLLGQLRRLDALDTLRRPGAVLTGAVGAVGVEAVMLSKPGLTRRLWRRPVVRYASLVGTVLGGRALSRRVGPGTVATLCWGLLAYLVLLGFVLAGRSNPVSALARSGDGE
jgi:hypothetical protein